MNEKDENRPFSFILPQKWTECQRKKILKRCRLSIMKPTPFQREASEGAFQCLFRCSLTAFSMSAL